MQNLLTQITVLGVDSYTLLLILFLPIVTTLVAVWRHVIGARTLSLYAPIVLAYAFIEMGLDRESGVIRFDSSLKYGLFVFVVVFIAATGIYWLLKPLRLHYFPKMAIVFSGVAAAMLTVLSLAAQFERYGLVQINIFSLVLTAAVSERLVTMFAKYNFRKTFYTAVETLILSMLAVALISWEDFQNVLLSSPWVLLLIILINLVVGRMRGLRLSEYWRFRGILTKDPNAQ